MEKLVNIFKALGDKNRLRIVKMLQQRTLCVCEITAVLALAPSTVSKHLSILKQAGLITDKKEGKWVYYSLNTLSRDLFVVGILPIVSFWLNDDEQVRLDIEKLGSINRDELCKI